MLTLASDLANALDPARFAASASLRPDPWQADVLWSQAPRILLNCSRQSGKSSVTAILALHQALYTPGSLVLLLSPSLRQSQELYRKVRQAYGQVAGDAPKPAEESALRIALSNGSRIVSLPGKEDTIRGYSGVNLLVIDEAARVPNDLYLAVRPMLAVSGGRLIALSTPFGTRGWWYEAWTQGGDDWERYEVPASLCPRISPEFLEEERRTLGPWWHDQEYGCKFLDAQTQAFTRTDIESAFTEEVAEWHL